MKKVTILALTLTYGGIEQAIANLSNMLCDKYDVEIICVYDILGHSAFPLNEKIKVTYLSKLQPKRQEWKDSIKNLKVIDFIKLSYYNFITLIDKHYKIRKSIKNIDSDIIISTRDLFHNKIVNKKCLTIAWEHVHHNNNKKYIKYIVNTCNKLDYLVCVSKELTNFYKPLLKKNNSFYIPLCIDEISNKTSNLDSNEITVMGRLAKEKGYLDLIDIFKLVLKEKDVKLNIIGDGYQYNEIKEKIKANGLEDKIIMHGFKSGKDKEKILLNTSVFLSTSYFESFGLVLLEAMNYGIPCISFDSARGSLEIIEDNKNGFIIKNRDFNDMKDKILLLLNDKKLRNKFSKEAKKTILNYSYDNTKREWLNFLDGDKR
jgi:N-acetylglucosaminyldiphosphoundecaprenol N-acetyl-beta-D-mannosaminyltransferase